jgi:hypothetical protein
MPPTVTVKSKGVVMLMVPVALAPAILVTCSCQGLTVVALPSIDVAVVEVVESNTLPEMPANVTSQSPALAAVPNVTAVIWACVCVEPTKPVTVEVLHLTMEVPTVNLESVADPLIDEVAELPIGVMNGATALVPLDAVMFGVAKAGDATTTTTDSSSNPAITPFLKVLMKSRILSLHALRLGQRASLHG